MKNKELIEVLKSMPPDMEVTVDCQSIIGVEMVDIKINGKMNHLIAIFDDEDDYGVMKGNFVTQQKQK